MSLIEADTQLQPVVAGRVVDRPHPHRPVYARVKRALDVVGALAALMVFAPLMMLLGLLLRLQDRGPALYVQDRVGRDGRRFRCFKLRTMRVDADALRPTLVARLGAPPPRFKLADDPRLTPLGRWLRRWSLDELPQFYNVLRGDMSLVGPRPLLPEEVAVHDRRALGRLEVEPGLTCIWQVSGRSLLPFERQVELDLDYIARRSFWLDALLIARTIPAVISGRGAC